MFETIGTLFTIAFWAVAIFLFGGGILMCFANIFTGDGLERFWAIVAVILGVIAFYYLYVWFENIPWCMLGTGIVLGALGHGDYDKVEKAPQPKEPGVIDKIAKEVLEKKAIEEAVENGVRKANQWK